ncbi:hypothetical protein NN561_000620 [Cricetulus griseus]
MPFAIPHGASHRLGMAAQQQSLPCLLPTPQATQCTVPDVHLFSTVPYVLNVTAVHPGGASSSLLAFVAERISECLSCRVPAESLVLYSSLTGLPNTPDSILPTAFA